MSFNALVGELGDNGAMILMLPKTSESAILYYISVVLALGIK